MLCMQSCQILLSRVPEDGLEGGVTQKTLPRCARPTKRTGSLSDVARTRAIPPPWRKTLQTGSKRCDNASRRPPFRLSTSSPARSRKLGPTSFQSTSSGNLAERVPETALLSKVPSSVRTPRWIPSTRILGPSWTISLGRSGSASRSRGASRRETGASTAEWWFVRSGLGRWGRWKSSRNTSEQSSRRTRQRRRSATRRGLGCSRGRFLDGGISFREESWKY